MSRFRVVNPKGLDGMDRSVAAHTSQENLTFFAHLVEKHLADWREGSDPAQSLGMVRQYARWLLVLVTWEEPGEFVPSEWLLDGEGEG